MEVMATVRREPVVAKKVYLHRNGLKGLRPKMIVVNERHIRDFSSFLNRVTSGIRAPVAVRSIYTPVGGRRINRLEDLENGEHYVAGGSEHFKKLRYSEYTNSLQKPTLKRSILESKIHLPVRTVQAASRFRNLPERPCSIHVFRNGDALFKGVKVLLPRRLMNSWEHILEVVTEKAELTLPAKRLCTLEGNIIHSVTDIKDGEKYVALEGARRFIKLPYTSIEPSPRPSNRRRQHIRMRRLTSTLTSTDTSTLQTTIQSTDDQPKIKRLMPIKQHKGVERPFAGHRNKAARNRALRYAQTDSAFGVDTQTTTVPVVDGPNTSIISEGEDTTTTTTEDVVGDDLHKSITIENEVDTSGTAPVSNRPNSHSTAEKQNSKLNDGGNEDNEDVIEEVQPSGPQDNDEETAMTVNGSTDGGITELQGQNPNENIDLSIARKTQQDDKDSKEQDKGEVDSGGDGGAHTSSVHSLPKPISQQSSKLQSKSNSPLNAASKSSLNAASKSSLKSKRSVKNESGISSKHSIHSQVSQPPPKTPTTQEPVENQDEETKD